MPTAKVNGTEIWYDVIGPEDGKPILLISGVGTQSTRWKADFVDRLVARGYRAIKMDNRDIGLSRKYTDHGLPDLKRVLADKAAGKTPDLAYTLSDMAADAVGLLDALGIDRAHAVGASMGGMIAQRVALEHPDRVLSLTSIMSTTGSSKVPPAKKEAMQVLTQRPKSSDKDTVVAHGVKILRTIEGRGFPQPERRYLEQATGDFERSFYPPGMPRQLAAIIADGDRTEELAKVTAPTLVLHGEDDPLVRCEGGHATAACIPGARLKTYPGMGHDFPLELIDEIADDIAEHARAT